jgi:hypothetical protein
MTKSKKQIEEILKTKGFNVISFNTKRKNFVAKKSYYYKTVKLDELVNRIKDVFPDVNIICMGDHFRPFYGGAKSGSSKDSYLWIEFNFKSDEI